MNGTIRTVSVSRDFKNNAGEKAKAFFYAEDLIVSLVLLPVVFLILSLQQKGAGAFWSTLLLPAGFALFTLCRTRPHRVWQSALLTPASAAAVCALLLLFGNLPCAAAVFCGMLVSFRRAALEFKRNYEMGVDHSSRVRIPVYRKRAHSRDERLEEEAAPTYLGISVFIFSGLFCCVTYFAALAFGFRNLALFCIADFGMVFAAMTIYNQKSGAYCLAQWDRLSGTANRGGASETGSSLLAFFSAATAAVGTGAVFLIALLGGNFRMDNAFLLKLSALFNAKPRALPNASAPQAGGDASQSALLKSLAGQKQANWPFADALKTVLNAVMWCAAAVIAILILSLIGSAVLRLYKKLNMGANEESRSLLFSSRSSPVPGARLSKKREHAGFFFRGGSRAAVRRLFYLYIKRHRTAPVKSSDTPCELARKAAGAGDAETAAALYEKARYGDGCSPNDVKRMKEALKSAPRA